MAKFKDYYEFRDWYSQKEEVYGDDAPTYFSQLAGRLTKTGKKLNMAKAAYISIFQDIRDHSEPNAVKAYNAVFDYAPRQKLTEAKPQGLDIYDTRTIERTFFPSSIENDNVRAGHVHLIDYIHYSGGFAEGKMSRKDIAMDMYSPYAVADVGGKENLVFTHKELRENNMTIDQVVDGLPYLMAYFEKQGERLVPWTENKYGDFTEEERMNPDTLGALLIEIQKTNSDATMWTAYRRSEDGKGMEVTINAGNHGTGKFETIGVWKYKRDDGEIENLIFSEDEMWKLLKDAWSNHYRDAENDFWEMSGGGPQLQDTLKEKIDHWYHQGIVDPTTKERKYGGQTGGTSYLAIPKWGIEVMDPRAFEYENIIKPFWEKYGPQGEDLSDAEFEKAWEDELRMNSYTFEERNMEWFTKKWREIIAPPGAMPGYGGVSQQMSLDIF